MRLLVPYEIETHQQTRPWANWAIVAACCFTSFALFTGHLSDEVIDAMVLDGASPVGLLGHIFLHVGFFHLVGNMVFLWVFGNAVCSNTNNLVYLATFVACTLIAAMVHLLVDGDPAIGASGAINGLVGIVFVMYPLNRVYLFWLIIIRGGTFACSAWMIIVAWFIFDIWGAINGEAMVAYWAHIGGFLGGVAIGFAALHFGWFQLTEYDNRSLLEIIRKAPPR